MLRTFTAWKHHILTKRRSPKVGDQTMYPDIDTEYPVYALEINQGRQPRTSFSIPLTILSCFSCGRVNVADGIWVTADVMSTPEVDQIMVSDSMRYAILM
ncbi:hypothetical protein vseg_008322 [Gypsophila vaccaria]